MRFFLYSLGILLGLAGLGGCKSSTLEATDTLTGADYFPTLYGSQYDYAIQETIITTLGTTTAQYQIREVLSQLYIDIEGDRAFILQRYRRNNSVEPWRLDSLWSLKRTPQAALRTEGSQVYQKLRFPLSEGLRWNGNAFNAQGADEYRARDLDKPYTLNNTTYPLTLRVIQADDSSLVSLDRRQEIYARNTGLIYKEIRRLNYCTQPNCIGRGIVETGRIYRQSLIAYMPGQP